MELPATRVELAGRELSGYPHYEFPRTFIRDVATGVIAIDPVQHPEIVGASCDLYVVEARSLTEWVADPTLTDARGASQAVDFTQCTTSIQNAGCAHAITGWASLSFDAEPWFDIDTGSGSTRYHVGLGRPYDLVLDCDPAPEPRGELSAFDYIDGGGEDAGLYLAHDTTEARLPVRCRDYRVQATVEEEQPVFEQQRIYVPLHLGDQTTCSGPSCNDTAPLIVISHGAGHESTFYDYLQSHLASYGFVVMAHHNDVAPLPKAAEWTIRHTNALLEALNSAQCGTAVQNQATCSDPESAATFDDVCDLADRIDMSKIVWIGHSRGGNGVVRAYNLLAPDHPAHLIDIDYQFDQSSIALLAGMAPIDRPIDGLLADPEQKPYLLLALSGDADVTGTPQVNSQESMSFQLYERAQGDRQSVYIQGGAHGFFHESCTPSSSSPDCMVLGPASVNDATQEEARVHRIVRRAFIPVLSRYLHGNRAAEDFFWRPYERFTGDSNPKVALEYKRGATPKRMVIDNFETWSNPEVSSSGRSVTQTMHSIEEGLLEDKDCHFDWERGNSSPVDLTTPYIGSLCLDLCDGPQCSCHGTGGFPSNSGTTPCDFRPACEFMEHQAMNGMTRSRQGSGSRGGVLEWRAGTESPVFEWDIGGLVDGLGAPPDESMYLSFRVAQMPRHPMTLDLNAELAFVVTLVDGDDDAQSLRLGSYDAEIVTPYGRTGPGLEHLQRNLIYDYACAIPKYGTGDPCFIPAGCNPGISEEGWQAEFETIRIRLGDFLVGGSGVDLDDLAVLRLEFGAAAGATMGRITIDDVEIVSTSIEQAVPCPIVEPCGEVDCEALSTELEVTDSGLASCRPAVGSDIQCLQGTVHVVRYGCSTAECCSGSPPCLCRTEPCPAGTYLECR